MSKYLKVIFLLMLLITVFRVSAEVNNKYIVSLSVGLYLNNEQAWQLEPSILWYFNKYVGGNIRMELTSQYNQPSRQTVIDGHEAELTDNECNIGWFIFKPSVVFKSPEIWKSNDDYLHLWIQAEPGISFACPFRNSLTYEIKEFNGMITNIVDYRKFSNKGLQWIYCNARASINLAIDRLIVGAGYYISDFDYYSCRRNVTLSDGQNFYVPKKELSQSIFIFISYSI